MEWFFELVGFNRYSRQAILKSRERLKWDEEGSCLTSDNCFGIESYRVRNFKHMRKGRLMHDLAGGNVVLGLGRFNSNWGLFRCRNLIGKEGKGEGLRS